MTKYDKQRQDLIIHYKGPRGGNCKLIIKDFDGDIEICRLLQNPEIQPEWKIKYLESLYDEQIRQPNKAKHHRYNLGDKAIAVYLYADGEGVVKHIKNFEDTPKQSLSWVEPEFARNLENQEVLEQLLSELTLKQKERTILFYLKGYSYTEIAQMQGVSPTAVRNSINRGFETIRKNFKEQVQKQNFSCLQSEKEKRNHLLERRNSDETDTRN